MKTNLKSIAIISLSALLSVACSDSSDETKNLGGAAPYSENSPAPEKEVDPKPDKEEKDFSLDVNTEENKVGVETEDVDINVDGDDK